MTYFAPDKVPYDEWFDPDYKYDPDKLDDYGRPPNPLDSMPIATDKGLIPDPIEETMHEKMYRLAVQKHSPWKGGGSENWQERHCGGSEQIHS